MMSSKMKQPPKTIDTLEEPLRTLFMQNLSEYQGQAFGTLEAALSSTNDSAKDRVKEFSELCNQRMALCVGAGLTAYFIGDWRTLLRKLLAMRCHNVVRAFSDKELTVNDRMFNKTWTKTNVDKYIGHLKNSFFTESTSTLEIGEYLMYDESDHAPKIGTEAEPSYREIFFAEQVRYVISGSIEKKLEKSSASSIEEYFVDLYRRKFIGNEKNIYENGSDDDEVKGIATLAAVVKLCIKKKIKNIVTYNFDMILDKLIANEEVWELFGETLNVAVHVHTYLKAEPMMVLGDKKSKNIVNIYHVHGVLDQEIEEVGPIIFSENSYQNYQKTILNWSNVRLADTMLKYDILCVGFSGDDANFRMLRRFLAESMTNPIMGIGNGRKKLYIMRSCGNEVENFINNPNFASMPECALASIKTYLELVGTYFKKQLGTEVIWSNGYLKMAGQINWLSECKKSRS